MATQSKAKACGRSLAGTAGSNPTRSVDVCHLRIFCFVQVEFSATRIFLAQRSPTVCVICVCVCVCEGVSVSVCVCLCVCVCGSLSVIRCNNNHLHLQGVGRRCTTKINLNIIQRGRF